MQLPLRGTPFDPLTTPAHSPRAHVRPASDRPSDAVSPEGPESAG